MKVDLSFDGLKYSDKFQSIKSVSVIIISYGCINGRLNEELLKSRSKTDLTSLVNI